MALSQDIRCRIVDLVNSGISRRQAARHFQVSVSSAIRFARQVKETGHVKVAARKPRKSRLDGFHDTILAWIAAQPDLTLDKGDVVILDNLPAHKRKEAEKAVKQRGAWLLFLHTRPTSTRSNWPSPNSKHTSNAWRREQSHSYGKPQAGYATCSRQKNAETSSKQMDMIFVKPEML